MSTAGIFVILLLDAYRATHLGQMKKDTAREKIIVDGTVSTCNLTVTNGHSV
jgi:hypothetical protein